MSSRELKIYRPLELYYLLLSYFVKSRDLGKLVATEDPEVLAEILDIIEKLKEKNNELSIEAIERFERRLLRRATARFIKRVQDEMKSAGKIHRIFRDLISAGGVVSEKELREIERVLESSRASFFSRFIRKEGVENDVGSYNE